MISAYKSYLSLHFPLPNLMIFSTQLLNERMKTKSIITELWKTLQGIWRCSWDVSKPQWCLSLSQEGKGRRGGDEEVKWSEMAGKAWKHHAYGCYSTTRWDGGSDIVKVANTCALALQAPLVCDQSALSAFLMNMCITLWQHQGVWHSMTSALKNKARGYFCTV